ncbi:hypothetical protein [Inconstantimicrobium mannanitabidum]|uniref:Uncharacterized protein n=1 Tax=Inconstantimicrobium mannanitabidum TaxID=1604901 RepID=A0ACB5R9I5_9CLOT|nr:hypothetical protein [Clostridium sp. TW13]GKX65529.1 hypothetical protein rsdtw13_07870 [Clostridium sp. TW13]
MRVIFSVATNYTLFVAYILTKTTYRDSYNILVTNDSVIDLATIERIKESKVWDEVIYVEERDNNKNMDLIDQIEEVDVLHIFTFGCGILTSYLMKKFWNYKTRIIFTEEGTATWNYLNTMRYAKCDLSELDILERIQEVWAFEERLIPYRHNIIVKKIETEYLINDVNIREMFLKDLNYIFSYKPEELDSQVILFDTYFSKAGIMNKLDEVDLDKALLELNKSMIVKLHPNDDLYSKSRIFQRIIKNVNVPWEVVYLNNLEALEQNTEFFFTIFPTAVQFNTKIINKQTKIRVVCLWRLLEKIIVPMLVDIFNEEVMKNVEKFDTIYDWNFTMPSSVNELSLIIEQSDCLDSSIIKYITEINTNNVYKKSELLTDSQESVLFKRTIDFLIQRHQNLKYCIWGTGGVAEQTICEINKHSNNFELISVIDNFKTGKYKGIDIYRKEQLHEIKCDIIFICTTIGKKDAEEFMLDNGLLYGKDYVYGYKVF